MCVYVRACVRACVCERELKRETETEREKVAPPYNHASRSIIRYLKSHNFLSVVRILNSTKIVEKLLNAHSYDISNYSTFKAFKD